MEGTRISLLAQKLEKNELISSLSNKANESNGKNERLNQSIDSLEVLLSEKTLEIKEIHDNLKKYQVEKLPDNEINILKTQYKKQMKRMLI